MLNPFRNILRLSLGDLFAKTLNFLAFVYLARTLGVASYGVLEFSISAVMYFLVAADGGLEAWATGQAARTADIRQLAARVLPLRLMLAAAAFCALLVLAPIFPNYPWLRATLLLMGLTLFTQVGNLKWVFMGRQEMTRVAAGLVVAQVIFAASVFVLVNGPERIVLVPILRVASDLCQAAYFARLFAREHGGLRLAFTLDGAREVLRPALIMGASLMLGLMMYNIDSVLLGFMLGPMAVAWYNAAYKPVTVALAMPVTYFLGLFPTLVRAHAESQESFREVAIHSLRLTSVLAVPLGVGGMFLAGPIIALLFGPDYSNSVPALVVLSWAAVLTILRGTYKHALNAAGRPQLDLRCAAVAAALNVGLNLIVIPRYGILGAASVTLVTEMVGLAMASYYFRRHLTRVRLLPFIQQPILAAFAMVTWFLLAQTLFWPVRAAVGVMIYFLVLLLLGETEVRSWFETRRA